MTPKQKVQKRYPNAYAYRFAGPCGWCIYSGNTRIERGKRKMTYSISLNVADKTAAQAWAAAAKHRFAR